MPYTKTDFSAAVDSHLATINAVQPLIGYDGSSPRGTIHDTRTAVFSRHLPTPYSVQLDCTFMNLSAVYINWADAYDTRKAAWHSNLQPDALANGVAITKRHVIVSEHGGQAYHPVRALVWPGYDQMGLTDDARYIASASLLVNWIVGTIGTVARDGIYGTPNPSGKGNHSFRLCYMQNDLPDGLVVPMLDPSQIGDPFSFFSGLPVCIFNQFYQATMQDCRFLYQNPPPYSGIDPTLMNFLKSTDPLRSKLYRPIIPGDSGSPVFLMKGTDEFVYLTHMTLSAQDASPDNAWAYGPQYWQTRINGPGYFLDNIIDACTLLNSRYATAFGGDPTLLPTYVAV